MVHLRIKFYTPNSDIGWNNGTFLSHKTYWFLSMHMYYLTFMRKALQCLFYIRGQFTLLLLLML